MNPQTSLFPQPKKDFENDWITNPSSRFALTLFLVFAALGASAQTVLWTDSFKKGADPTPAQCQNWTGFLDALGGKSFMSVTLSGSNDPVGISISDPAAVNQLAHLLHTRTPGTVTSGGNVWTVSDCFQGACNAISTALSVNGNTSGCSCDDQYTIRPHSPLGDWGGLRVTNSCGADDQSMTLVFSSGVTISGSDALCQGGTTVLTANSQICGTSPGYLWSNGATTQSITVDQPGSYFVTVSDGMGCSGVSETVVVRWSDVNVVIEPETLNYCDAPVQLQAVGSSSSNGPGTATDICIFDAPGIFGVDDCTFTSTVCFEGAIYVENQTFTQPISFTAASKITYNIYYTANSPATFRFKLNDNVVGTHYETITSGACDSGPEGKFPQSFTFSEEIFRDFWKASDNAISVEVETVPNGIYLAGLTAEVVSVSESYTWSPADGLTNAFISNPLATPSQATDYTVTYRDANGCEATDVIKVDVKCDAVPVANCQELTYELTEGCAIDVPAAAFDNGSTSGNGGALTFSAEPAGPYSVGTTDVIFTAIEGTQSSLPCTTKITVIDKIEPVIDELADVVVQNDDASCAATVELVAPTATDNCAIESIENDQEDNLFDVGETVITWTVTDKHGNTKSVTQKVIVENADPVITAVQVSSSSVGIGNALTLTVTYDDNNAKEASIDWGDLTAPQVLEAPAETFEVTHSYARAGAFDITVTITDHCDAVATYVQTVSVFDRSASVKGNGWFNSQAGYYFKDPRAAGKAQFSFSAKYSSGASVPTGNVNFRFKDAKIDFRSTELLWLTIEDDRATLMGSGRIGGKRGYSILLSAVDVQLSESALNKKGKKDKDKDLIRVKIWDPAGNVIYDTQAGQPDGAIAASEIGGGSVEINRSNTFIEQLNEAVATHFGNEGSSVHPNPFVDYLNIRYSSSSNEEVIVQLLDLSGRAVVSEVFPVSEDGFYSIDVPENAHDGIYILTIKQGKKVEYLRLVRK